MEGPWGTAISSNSARHCVCMVLLSDSIQEDFFCWHATTIHTNGCTVDIHESYTSPMASLVLTDSSQLTSDGFEKLPDQIMYPYAKPDDLQKHVK
uniref:Uncharacterized protein n=1 Tax=Timema poppense TaxID=170557 RepID=A0A7R9DSA3_TIMPO|nr:unnamed protein product [Timema poppensis]